MKKLTVKEIASMAGVSVTAVYFTQTARAAAWEEGLPNTQEEGEDRSSGFPAKLVEIPPASERITDPAA